MAQKLFKKSTAFKMGISRNGFKTRRSLSPVIMQEALTEIANSRNLSSLGSRQAVILSVGEKKTAFNEIRCIALHFSSLFKKLSLIHISEPTRQAEISYAVFCL